VKAFDHSGRAAVVTGGNGGIGLGMARGLAKAGPNVAIAGRNAEKNAAAVGELQALGARVLAIEADVTVEQDCRRLVEVTAARFGRLDILVNNAGIALRKRPEDYTAHDWHLVIDSNLTSAFLCSRAAYPHMTKAGGGKIINIGSILATMSAPFAVAYSASKGGIVPDDACAGHRLGPRKVSALLPGLINTELTDNAPREVDGLADRVSARTAPGRWGEPEDFEAVTVLLAGSGSQYITGAAIPVDGGYSIQA
jgi:2-deoxy-D-gluconate 3-dehydrogenase